MHCEGCPLFEKIGKEKVPVLGPYRRKVGEGLFTNLKGFGNTDHPDLVVVTDGPSAEDLSQGQIMTGDQRTVLANELAANGFDGNKAYYMPAHRCHLTIEEKQNKKLVKSVLEHCKPYVNDVLKYLQPKMVLTLGDMAFKQVLNQTGISKRRGMLQYSEDFKCWVMPTYATGFCLRDQKQFAKWRPDISQMFQFIKNGYRLMETGELDYRDVESIKPLIASNPEAIAVDTETQGKDFANPNSIVISYSVSTSPTNGYNIWLATEVVEGEHDFVIKWPRKVGRKEELVDVFVKKADRYDEKVEELRTILSSPTIKKYMMNGNYDLHRFRQLGIERDEIKAYTLDIQSVMHTLDPDMYKRASLQDIQSAVAPYRVDHKAKFAQEVDKSDMLNAAKENPERHSQYACGDTASTFDCAVILKDRLCTDTRLAEYYIKLVHPVTTEVLYEIEKNGVLFDQERLPAAKEKVAEFLKQQTDKFISLMPRKVLERQRDKGLKLSRTDLLRDVLFSKEGFNLNPLEKTPAGGDGVGRKLLVRMRDELDDNHPAKELISTYIEWGPYQKLYSTYLNGFPKCVFPDGRFHPNISKCATATGRTAVSNPNLQQIPKRNKDIANVIRSLIIADPGYSFVTADASQAELRWIAARGHEEILRQIYKDSLDVHTHTAEMLIHIDGRDAAAMTDSEMKAYRTKAKAVNFGLCLTKGTKVITLNGIVPIEDVCVGDIVLTHKKRYRRVTETQQLEATKLIKIRTKTGREVTCTPDHMMLVHFPSANGRPGKKGFVPACDLVVGEYLVHHNTVLDYAETCPLTAEEARIVGWYVSEGRLSSGSLHVSQSRTANSDICDHMDVVLGEIGFKQLKDGFTYSGNTKEMRRLLNLAGVSYEKKSYGIDFDSDSFCTYPVEIRRQLIAGLWDGDGCISVKKDSSKTCIQYSSASSKLLRDVQKVLDSLGMTSTIYEYETSNTKILHIAGSASMQLFMETIPTIKRNGVLYMPKKQFAGEERITEIIEYECTPTTVYDLTVEEDHSFVANGLCTHNCFGMQAKKLQAYARDEYGVKITLAEAEAFRKGFFTAYPSLEGWHRDEIAKAKEQGFVRTDYGFVRRLANINSKDFAKRSEDERAAINTPIQSASNDTVLFSALTAHRQNICEDKAKLVCFIHDELIYMVKDDFIPTFAPRLYECMVNPPIKETFGIDFPIPFGSDIQVGKTLATLEDYQL